MYLLRNVSEFGGREVSEVQTQRRSPRPFRRKTRLGTSFIVYTLLTVVLWLLRCQTIKSKSTIVTRSSLNPPLPWKGTWVL